jgi:hypothetical protein
MAASHDIEANNQAFEKEAYENAGIENSTKTTRWSRITNTLASKGDIELGGCQPVPYEDRTETNYFNIFTLWFSMSCNPLPYVTLPNPLLHPNTHQRNIRNGWNPVLRPKPA